MKLLFDYFPILCFFIAYKLYGIYVATAVTMAVSALQVGGFWLKYRRFDKLHVITLLMVVFLGGTTLILHDAIFIKLKPSVIYWIFSLALLISQYCGEKNLMERMLGDKMQALPTIWKRINLSWCAFFFLMGFLNLYVVYHFNTNTWVNFKLFGTLGLTFVFAIIQAVYLSKHVSEPTMSSEED